MQPPVMILAPPRSFTSIACAMLGQHPDLYGLPETDLFTRETMLERSRVVARATYPMNHGLLRAVAELFFGGQTGATVAQAREWLRARESLSTAQVFRALADQVSPRALVDKSITTTGSRDSLARLRRGFPSARYLHLVRHPIGFGESVMRFRAWRITQGPLPRGHWLERLSAPTCFPEVVWDPPDPRAPDPQRGWYAHNRIICEFLDSVPGDAQLRVHGEELLAEPDDVLARIAEWLGLRSDPAAIGDMKHPECSPFADFGPPGARYGNDAFFLRDPAFRPRPAKVYNSDQPLSWRNDGYGLLPEVRRLARELGCAS